MIFITYKMGNGAFTKLLRAIIKVCFLKKNLILKESKQRSGSKQRFSTHTSLLNILYYIYYIKKTIGIPGQKKRIFSKNGPISRTDTFIQLTSIQT